MRRPLKLGLLALLALLVVCVPDADAQKRRGGRRGGRGLFAGTPRGGGGRLKKTHTTVPTGILKKGPAAKQAPGKGADPSAKAAERRFENLIDEIDAALADADERFAALDDQARPAIAIPRDLEPGSEEWNELQRPIWEACDRDRSGWVSFREARDALGLDQADYALYDRDQDGRIGTREFLVRYDEVVAATGVFPLPQAESPGARVVPRSPRQLEAAFDADGDRALDTRELGVLLTEYDREEIEPKVALERLDLDASGKVEGAELAQLSRLISAAFLLPEAKAPQSKSTPRKVEGLFCEVIPRIGTRDQTSLPPLIAGPVTHFRRLDLDDDGFISMAELHELQSPLQLRVRAGAVLAALDDDEDGLVSRHEFLNSLRPPRQ